MHSSLERDGVSSRGRSRRDGTRSRSTRRNRTARERYEMLCLALHALYRYATALRASVSEPPSLHRRPTTSAYNESPTNFACRCILLAIFPALAFHRRIPSFAADARSFASLPRPSSSPSAARLALEASRASASRADRSTTLSATKISTPRHIGNSVPRFRSSIVGRRRPSG